MTTVAFASPKGHNIKLRPVCTEAELAAGGGFCTHCGETTQYCEPDGRRLRCESCGVAAVYGLEELLLAGILDLKA